MSILNELKQEFQERNIEFEDDEAASNCASLCAAYRLEPADLADSWEVFALNEQVQDGVVKNARLPSFRAHLTSEEKATLVKKEHAAGLHFYTKDSLDEYTEKIPTHPSSYATTDIDHSKQPPSKKIQNLIDPRKKVNGEGDEEAHKLPASESSSGAKLQTENSDEQSTTAFTRRTNQGTVVSVVNDSLNVLPSDSNGHANGRKRKRESMELSQISSEGVAVKPGCRYMCDQLEERFKALNEQIVAFTQTLAEVVDNFEPSKQNFYACQETAMVVGRICCEAEGGRLNDKSLVLEASVQYGHGHRIRLDLRNIPTFSLFPGQIVAVRGENPSGFCLMASQIIDSLPLPMWKPPPITGEDKELSPTKVKEKTEGGNISPSTQPAPFHMMVAAGPFTTGENLAFEPLQELLKLAKEKQPDVLMLIGPFVDSEHPKVKDGTLDVPFEQIFQKQVRQRVEMYCEEVGDEAKVILLPSIRDAHHDVIFPQPPFNREDWEVPANQILTLGNPGVFTIGEVGVVATSMDILRHLSSEEVSRNPAGAAPPDRVGRLASHLIGQQSFYPLFPPYAGTPLDMSMSPTALKLPFTPHMLLLPSDLAPFVKVLPQVSLPPPPPTSGEEPTLSTTEGLSPICINPGRLAKGLNGGTYADVTILMGPQQGHAGKVDLTQNAKVKIVRI